MSRGMGVSRTAGEEGRDTSAIQIGDLMVTPFVSSRFRLDGGSMFGVIPIWRMCETYSFLRTGVESSQCAQGRQQGADDPLGMIYPSD